MRKTRCILLVGVLALSQPGCTTKLWDATNPNERIWIGEGEISEAELKKRGVEYEVYSSETCPGFLVEKSAMNKFKDYNLRMLGTPVTLAVDAAASVVVGAALVLYSNPEATCVLLNEVCN